MNKLVEFINKGCLLVGLIGGTTSMILLIAIIGIFKECVGPKEDPMDISIMKQRECYDRHIIEDSTGVGFELLWYTTKPVTPKRLDEIQSREPIRKAQRQLLQEAPGHFNHDFFHTDIHDFARYARQFDVDPDVRLVNLFVYGEKLKRQYLRPNPNLPDACTEYNSSTDQGILYLEEHDIYPYNPEAAPTYRYWKCRQTSTTDERYTHFTNREYIQR